MTTAAGLPDAAPPPAVPRTADEAVTALHAAHYRSLVRLSALLLRGAESTDLAEEVVQDAFVAMHGRWRRLRDPEAALAYLRQSVVNRSRSALRHRGVVDRHAERVAAAPLEVVASAESSALAGVERGRLLAALRTLPDRQREVLVLRYYADLSEAQIAAALGIAPGSVKSHAHRGIAALRRTLEGADR